MSKKENIEKTIKILEDWLKEMNDLFNQTHINNTKERNALEHILSDYKRVLKENEQLKQMLDERFIYVTGARTVYTRLMQLDKEIIVKDDLKRRNEIKQLLKENEELKDKWDKDTHKLQNDLDIANAEKIELQKENEKLERANKCYINSIQSIAPVLLQDYIEKQKIKDKIEELNKKMASEENKKVILWLHKQMNVLQDLLEDKGE